MSNGQINIRINADLKRRFQSQIKLSGLDTTKLLTTWIEEFVEGKEISLRSTVTGQTLGESTEIEATISDLSQKVRELEETVVILSLIQRQNFKLAERL
jgi:antitoxin component of RelBE/YafQ-DinJ toxin-antitoxin module